MRVLPCVLSIIFLLHDVAGVASEPMHPVVPPKYCDLSGRLTMEQCALVNYVLAEKFFSAAFKATTHGNDNARMRATKKTLELCDRKWEESHAETGGGTQDDVVYKDCMADVYHAVAAKLLGLSATREIIPNNSYQAPSYCVTEGINPYGCAYINRLIAIDYLRRVEEFAIGSPQLSLDEVEATCEAQSTSQSDNGRSLTQREKFEKEQILQLKCVRQQLHEAATAIRMHADDGAN
ncbi:hypothetical protein [Pseudomonas sp. Pseusp97]|uniref:hypothetical protein n=1 Tax=Pseudomonas sp. Pseusp97 TaxID=3243065 RepID=UPI0039A461FD